MRRSSSCARGSELPDKSIAPPEDQKLCQCNSALRNVSETFGAVESELPGVKSVVNARRAVYASMCSRRTCELISVIVALASHRIASWYSSLPKLRLIRLRHVQRSAIFV